MGTFMEILINVGEFLLFTVIIKIIVGRWCAEKLLEFYHNWISANERLLAIWQHHHNQHQPKNIMGCETDNCVFL